jgi:hypothetical protein
MHTYFRFGWERRLTVYEAGPPPEPVNREGPIVSRAFPASNCNAGATVGCTDDFRKDSQYVEGPQ